MELLNNLNLPEDATKQDVKIKFRQLLRANHPDKFMNESEEIRKIQENKTREIIDDKVQLIGGRKHKFYKSKLV